MESQEVDWNLKGNFIYQIYPVNGDFSMAFGTDTIEMPVMFAVQMREREIVYKSEPDLLGYDTRLYRCDVGSSVIILVEIGTEYCSILDCYELDTVDLGFGYLGNFDVSLPQFEDIGIDNSYPVDRISVSFSEQTVRFSFQESVILRPYDSTAHTVDSVTYRYKFGDDSLSLLYPK